MGKETKKKNNSCLYNTWQIIDDGKRHLKQNTQEREMERNNKLFIICINDEALTRALSHYL